VALRCTSQRGFGIVVLLQSPRETKCLLWPTTAVFIRGGSLASAQTVQPFRAVVGLPKGAVYPAYRRGRSSVLGDIRPKNFSSFKIVGALRPCDGWSSGGSFRSVEWPGMFGMMRFRRIVTYFLLFLFLFLLFSILSFLMRTEYADLMLL